MEIYKIYVTPIKRNFNYSLCIKEYKGNKNKTKYKTNIRKNHWQEHMIVLWYFTEKTQRPIESYKRCYRTSDWTGLKEKVKFITNNGSNLNSRIATENIIHDFRVISSCSATFIQWKLFTILYYWKNLIAILHKVFIFVPKILESQKKEIKDWIEINIRQRGEVGGSAKKVGMRIKELERLYGVYQGGHGSNQYMQNTNNSDSAKTQKKLASQLGMSVDTLENYKMLADMIPELDELIQTGIVTKDTTLAIIKNLSNEEQREENYWGTKHLYW